MFDADAIQKLRLHFASVCKDFEAELVEMDGEDDHVHLLMNYPPKVAVSSLAIPARPNQAPLAPGCCAAN